MTKPTNTLYTGRDDLNLLGGTPFFVAAHKIDVELMRFLIAHGADPNLPNEDDTTPLMAATGLDLYALGENPGTVEEIAAAVTLCLELGANPNAVNADDNTPLHGAASSGATGAIQLLADAGAKLDARNRRGWTPLRVAAGIVRNSGVKLSPESVSLIKHLLAERGLPIETLSDQLPRVDDAP